MWESGFVSRRVPTVPGVKGPTRRLYGLTSVGKTKLVLKMKRVFAEAPEGSPEVDFALMNLGRFERRVAVKLLLAYEQARSARLDETVRAARKKYGSGNYGWIPHAIFSRHASVLKAERAWARQTRRALERGGP